MSDKVSEFVHADVESRMTTFLGKEEVLKEGSWGRTQAKNLASEVCAQKSNSLFENVIFTCEVIRDLLTDDISAMANALERFGNMAEGEILEGGVLQFLQKHKIGMQIISKCEARLLNLLRL